MHSERRTGKDPDIVSVAAEGDALRLGLADGSCRLLLGAMLRENSPDPATTHPVTRERLISLGDLPDDIRVLSASLLPGQQVEVRFSDGHAARYPCSFLRGIGAERASPPRVIWDASTAPAIAAHHWSRVHADPAAERAWLESVQRYGFARMRGTPPSADFLEALALRVGPIRETNFGRIFDVRTTAEQTSNAYTAVALPPHTDLSTREYQPGLQYLHCVANAAEGGDSVLVDGLAVCRRLAEVDAAAWTLLTSRRLPFANRSADCDYRHAGPVIELDAQGEPDTLRFTMWLRAPLAGPIEEARALYRALRSVIRLAEDPSLVFSFRLAPGDLLLMDNRRILHGRRAFSPETGERWLRGCYAERDDVASRLRMLDRLAEG